MSDINKIEISYTGVKPIVMLGAWSHDIKILSSKEDLNEWERRMEALTGIKYDAQEILASGGCCCGGGGGMCDND